MTLKKALEKTDAAVEAYRNLHRTQHDKVDDAQRAAANLLIDAQRQAGGLNDADFDKFSERFSAANYEIERLEDARELGDVAEDLNEEDSGIDTEEPDDGEAEKAEMYSTMVEPEADDEI